MGRLYLSAHELFTKREFAMLVPAYYHPHMPDSVLNPEPAPRQRVNRFKATPVGRHQPFPFNPPIDPDRMQQACYSVEVMVIMLGKRIRFQIINEFELPEIMEAIDRYLLSVRTDVECGEEKAVAYARRVLELRKEIYKHYFRFMKNDETARNELHPGGNPTGNLLYLLGLSGGRSAAASSDPLRAMGYPPYEVDRVKPKDKTDGYNPDDFIGNYIGTEVPTKLQDDGKDWNFEKFLEGR